MTRPLSDLLWLCATLVLGALAWLALAALADLLRIVLTTTN